MGRPGFLARTMIALRTSRRTGILRVSAEGARTFVYFKEGTPIFAEEGSAGETLGRLLVRLRAITHDQYLHVISEMTRAMFHNEQIRFGETAVELGYLTEPQVMTALTNQVRWKVIRCFQFEEVEFSFEDSIALVEDVGEFPMAIESLVYEAMLWLDSERRLDLALGEVLDKYPFVAPDDRSSIGDRLGLTGEDAALLDLLDGGKRVRDLVRRPGSSPDADPATPRPLEGIEPIVTALRMLGLATFADERRREVQLRANAARAGAAVAVASPPTSQRQPALREPVVDRRRTSQIIKQLDFLRVASQDDADLARTPANPREKQLLGEQAFQRGKAHLAAERVGQALRALRRALELVPENQEYAIYALWCETRSRIWADPSAGEAVKQAATAAVRRDPNFAFGYYVLGCVAFAANDLEKAKRFLTRTLTLDASLADAASRLRLAHARLQGKT